MYENTTWDWLSMVAGYWVKFPKMADLGLCSGRLLGQLGWLPCRPLDFIRAEYGQQDWARPNPNHGYRNLVPNGQYSPDETGVVYRRF